MRCTHVVTCISSSFFWCWSIFHCINIPHVFIYSLVDGFCMVSNLWLLGIMQWISSKKVLLGHMFSFLLGGLLNLLRLLGFRKTKFLRNWQIVFKLTVSFYILTSKVWSCFSTFFTTLGIVCLFYYSQSCMQFTVILKCISPKYLMILNTLSCAWWLYVCLFWYVYISLIKCMICKYFFPSVWFSFSFS